MALRVWSRASLRPRPSPLARFSLIRSLSSFGSPAAATHGSRGFEAGTASGRPVGGASSDAPAAAPARSPEEERREEARRARYARVAALSSRMNNPDPERKRLIDEILRVDHAGEFGAVRIYAGQEMKQTEIKHLEDMEKLLVERRVRPTALLPVWDIAGFALGAASAVLGREAAMACTVAVEEVISEHYNDQIRELLARSYDEEDLTALLQKNRDEELEHLHTAEDNGAKQAPMYDALTNVIKVGCKAAIWASKSV